MIYFDHPLQPHAFPITDLPELDPEIVALFADIMGGKAKPLDHEAIALRNFVGAFTSLAPNGRAEALRLLAGHVTVAEAGVFLEAIRAAFDGLTLDTGGGQ